MLYNISNPDLVIREINKLQPLNYNRFFWWRRFTKPFKDLPQNAPFLDKIINGDFEFSHFYFQALYCEMEINQKHKEYRGDIQKLLENDGIAFQRRKKLWEDFEKSEALNLQELRNNFLIHFDITRDQYEEEIGEFDGTTEEFYYYIRKNYESTGRTYKKRGRPPKNKLEY